MKTTVYFPTELDQFIEELRCPDHVVRWGGTQAESRSGIITALSARYALMMLKGQVADRQIQGVQGNNRRLLKLAVFVMRAERGEPGYVRVPGPMSWHGDNEPTADEIKAFRLDKKNQYVVGPGGEAP